TLPLPTPSTRATARARTGLPAVLGPHRVRGAGDEWDSIQQRGEADHAATLRGPVRLGERAALLRDAAGEPLVGQVLTMGNFRLPGDGPIDGCWNLLLTDRHGRFVCTGVTPGDTASTSPAESEERRSPSCSSSDPARTSTST